MAAVTDDTAPERRFQVRRVLLGEDSESWTVIGEDFEPVEVVDRYLASLTPLRSPGRREVSFGKPGQAARAGVRPALLLCRVDA